MSKQFYVGRLPVKALVSSLESAATGNSIRELEYAFFGRFNDLDTLKSIAVDVEEQIQYSILKPNGTVRVRSINDSEYELTTKVWKAGVTGKDECTNPTSKDQFDHFREIADTGMRKTRYIVPIEGTEGTWKPTEDNPEPKYNGCLFWEFDVFFDKVGDLVTWIKVDLEVPAPLETIPPFPISINDVIWNQYGHRTPEEEELIRSLFDTHFTFKQPQ